MKLEDQYLLKRFFKYRKMSDDSLNFFGNSDRGGKRGGKPFSRGAAAPLAPPLGYATARI